VQPVNFSIVINTYNRAAWLATALESLRYLDYPAYEIVVVNGPSDDATSSVLSDFHANIKVAHCAEVNLSVSRNIGIRHAAGDVVAFMDDDAIPDARWLKALSTAYQDPQVAAAGGWIFDNTGYSFQAKYTVCDRAGDALQLTGPNPTPWFNAPGLPQYCSLTGTNSSFRRTFLHEIGGFDEEYAYFLDETDVCLRLIDRGHRIVFVDNAFIYHKFAPSHLRNVNRIPKSLYRPSRSKSYFCLRFAGSDDNFGQAFQRIQDYETGLRRDNDWLANNGAIDQNQKDFLNKSLADGLRDGMREALASPVRKLMKPEDFLAPPPFINCARPQRRRRICLISQDFPPAACGGIGVWTTHVAHGLSTLGHEVHVISRQSGGAGSTVDFESGVWVHRLDGRATAVAAEASGIPPRSVDDWSRSVYHEVRRSHEMVDFEVVSAPVWDLEGWHVWHDPGLPSLVSLHSTYQCVLPHKREWQQNSGYRLNHVQRVIEGERRLLQSGPLLLANSKAIIEELERAYALTIPPERYRLVHHGIPDQSHHARPRASAGGVEVLFVGRLESRKGADVLLACIPQLCEQFPELRFRLVGEDVREQPGQATPLELFRVQHDALVRSGRVVLTGRVSDEELLQSYASCDIFVAPSRFESFGLIVLEAMMFGKPVVSCNVGGIAEVCQDGVEGILAPPGDSAALAAGLARLAANSELRQKMGAAARKRYLAGFTLEHMISGLVKVYDELLLTKQRGVRC
jgi:glycosyltransferase involved in cell wall biosynthesis/GT2 family glycosyltransferase